MKTIHINCLYLTAILGLCACGNGPIDKLSESTTQTSVDSFAAGDFVASRSLKLRSIPQPGEEGAVKEFELPEGVSVSVIETKVDSVHGTIVRLGIDANEESGLPSDVWVALDQALLLGLVKEEISADEIFDDAAELDEDIPGETPLAKAKRKAKKKMTYCYRYVKRYLMSTGKVKVYLPGESAFMAAKLLPKHGFKKTGHTPKTAKNGEVCVYSGGPQGHGHIEVKRNGKWWYGYGFLNQSMQGRNFIACFTK